MLFADSETQKLLRDTARSFLRDRYPWERLYALERGEAQLSPADLKEFATLGWLGLVAPESAGGAGASLLDAAVVIEEFGYAGVPAPVLMANLAAYILAAAPSPETVRHSLDLTGGARLYTVAEANRWTGEGAAAPSSEGGWLTGSLPLVPFGGVADYVIAPISSDGEPAIALMTLDAARREPVRVLDRADYCDVLFEDVLADGVVLLAEGQRAADMRNRLDALSTVFGLSALAGLMQRVTEMTAEYISNRVQFGQPIAKFQAARHHAADMLMQTQTARWAAYHALDRFEKDPADTGEIWLAKYWAVRASQIVFELAHLLHGGVGVGTEYPLHLLTQGIAAWAVRAGDVNEMVGRINGSLGLAGARSAA
ncbi:MAG TPA: acyl-CoA dehydrogenase family protein [Dehalococcoidia bacterium]|nr:acyl-CoA dehydrogenase family protein [Dehalococcoidia bacterium]